MRNNQQLHPSALDFPASRAVHRGAASQSYAPIVGGEREKNGFALVQDV